MFTGKERDTESGLDYFGARYLGSTIGRWMSPDPAGIGYADAENLGGPVEVPAVTALLQTPDKIEGADRIFSGIYMISTKTLLERTLATRPDPQAFRVYLGHAGWTSDQLQKANVGLDLGWNSGAAIADLNHDLVVLVESPYACREDQGCGGLSAQN
jgi:hypothetical protein